MAPSERRTYAREVVRWYVEWLDDTSGSVGTGTIYDVSGQGLFIGVDDVGARIAPGAKMRLHFLLNHAAPVDVTGTVRWKGRSFEHRCFGVGVEFEQVQTEINQFVSRVPQPQS